MSPRRAAIGACWLLLATAGCGSVALDDTYGRRRGLGAQSVAGTSVLAAMFEQSGCRVSSWSRISPKLNEFDVLFWAPDDFLPPTLQQRVALERWLAAGSGRRLVYVGRDFDALSFYWRRMLPETPAAAWEEAAARLARARAAHDSRRAATPRSKYARWFTVEGPSAPRRVTRLESPAGWADDVDAAAVELQVATQLRAAEAADALAAAKDAAGQAVAKQVQGGAGGSSKQSRRDELIPLQDELQDEPEVAPYQRFNDMQIPDSQVLLDSDAGPLVRRVSQRGWSGGEVLVVANGGFLLNLPLVNAEHRKLAQRLIDHCGAGRDVVFLESGPGGPAVFDQEPAEAPPSGLELFTVWPIGLVMIHLLALGVLGCFVLFPGFGRARELPAPSPSDFGQHIEAVGELLAQTGGARYVAEQLEHYHQVVKRDSGASHTTSTRSPEPPA